MPSLILTGHPCTGKSTFAHLFAARALIHPSKIISNVIHITESTACPNQTKSECYSNSHMEKSTRAALKSDFDRAVMSKTSCDDNNSTLIILDSLNYIKGYRYELYCISKAAGESHGVVWIMGGNADGGCLKAGVSSSSDELAKRRNRQRKELQQMTQVKDEAQSVVNEIDLDGYFEDDEAMDSLVLRYEPPDQKNRWENPLYKVDVTSVLPWGKDGTLEVSPETSKLNNDKDESSTLTSEMKAMEVKDQPIATTKPVKKSASGFKRRSKKTTPKHTQSASTQSTLSSAAAPTAPQINVPSSMASRNLTPVAASSSDNDNQEQSSKQTMENVIDGILDSFLMNTASLKQGQSTLSHVSTESNALNEVDNLTQRVNNEILKAQKSASISAGVGGKVFVTLSSISSCDGDERRAITLAKPLYVNELRNCRRQFLKWNAGHPMPDGVKEEEIVEGYISYIESNL